MFHNYVQQKHSLEQLSHGKEEPQVERLMQQY